MPLDPMIANPAKFDMGDPLTDYNNYLVAANHKSTLDKARREREQMNALNSVFAMPGAINPDGSPNAAFLMNALAKKGLGSAVPGQWEQHLKSGEIGSRIGENNANAGLLNEKVNTEKSDQGLKGSQAKKADAEARGEQVKTFDQKWKTALGFLNGTFKDANQGKVMYEGWVNQQFADPDIGEMLRGRGMTPESMKAEAAAAAQAGLPAFQNFILQKAIGMKDATAQTVDTVDNGGTNVRLATPTNSLGVVKDTKIGEFKVTESPKAPRVSVSVGAPSVSVIAAKGDTSYTEAWNKELAQDDIALKRAADKAPELARRADRMDAALRSGKVITGVGAPFFLNVAKVLNTVGGSDSETIANTEVLFSDLARNTLDQIQSSGLGSGNGFSNNDLKFLERAVGGDPSMSNGGMQQLVALSRRAAQLSAQRWAERKAERDRSGIQGRANPGSAPSVPAAPAPKPSAHSNEAGYQQAVAALKAGKISKAVFDRKYGAGAAASVGVK